MIRKTSPGRRISRRDDGDAFIPDPARGVFIAIDDAESLAEEFIAGATSADFVSEEARNELASDELGGPFITDDVEADEYEGEMT